MLKNITLEVSLKPFKKTDSEYIEKVCREIFEDWRPLVRDAETVSVMMWSADGSELLDYAGELADAFEWCRFIGTANLPYLPEGVPEETSLHRYKRDYMKKPPQMTTKF